MISGSSAYLWVVLGVAAATMEPIVLPGSASPANDRKKLGLVHVAVEEPRTVTLPSVTGTADAPINLKLKAPLEDLRFVLLRDIAPEVMFSHGFRMRNSWIASIGDIENLQVIVPKTFVGSLIFDVLFHRIQGEAAARGVVVIDVKAPAAVMEAKRPEPQQHPARAVVGTLAGQEEATGAERKVKGVPPEEEKQELARAGTLVALGDIGTARLIYQNLALRGSASGARALAETYDPSFSAETPIAGLQPDIEAARKWYKVAAEPGDTKAAMQLNRLAQREPSTSGRGIRSFLGRVAGSSPPRYAASLSPRRHQLFRNAVFRYPVAASVIAAISQRSAERLSPSRSILRRHPR